MIKVSAPGKIHLLGEHFVVYGKPALLAAVDLRVTVILRTKSEGSLARLAEARAKRTNASISGTSPEILHPDIIGVQNDKIKKIIEPIVKKHLKIKTIPPYHLEISSQIPINAGLGSSAAVSASYIAVLLSFIKVDWNLNLINELTYEAEKVFHGNPSGGDNSTVVFGGFIWFRKETPNLKIIQPLNFKIPRSRNFVLINTGTPRETTKEMVELVSAKYRAQSAKFKKIFDSQEQLVRDLLPAIQDGKENQLIQIIKAGEKNLEKIRVVSNYATSIIRNIEKAGGAAKMCGAGSTKGPTGIILAYHPDRAKIEKIAKSCNLPYFSTALGVEGVRQE